MSFLTTAPDMLATAASDLAGIGSTISTANSTAATPTTVLPAAAEDEVSAAIAQLFSQHGQGYQRVSAQVAAFHEQFVATLTSGARAYATTETNAAQTLANTATASARAAVEHPLAALQGAVSNAAGRIEGALAGAGGAVGQANPWLGVLGGGSSVLAGERAAVSSLLTGPLALRPTGGLLGLAGAASHSALSNLTNGAAVPVALAGNSIAQGIENLYNLVEPYVQYGFQLLSYAVGFVPYVGILAPQIMYFYNLFEPIVQAALFNTLDWLSGAISFGQGLSNFFATTSASINFFIQTEINWFLSFLPPLPPLPPFFPF
jgi:hypothetical protein